MIFTIFGFSRQYEQALLRILARNFVLILFACLSVACFPSESGGREGVRIWQDTPVRNKSVTLVPYLPDTNLFGGAAVIVCPGGSYCWHDYETEGVMVAEWLRRQGVAAFLLKYRVQGIVPYITHSRAIFGGHKHPDMIEDIQRALQLVRDKSQEYNVVGNRIGVMGFSAGGHLAMSAACYSATDFLALRGIGHSTSLRPDFVAAIYPVVSMSHPSTHKRSRRALLGEWGKFKKNMRDSLSLEKHVPQHCPPVFLMNCKDDPIVNYRNSELLDSALNSKGISHLYIQYATGGHGFGASPDKGTPECRQWRTAFMQWFSGLFPAP